MVSVASDTVAAIFVQARSGKCKNERHSVGAISHCTLNSASRRTECCFYVAVTICEKLTRGIQLFSVIGDPNFLKTIQKIGGYQLHVYWVIA